MSQKIETKHPAMQHAMRRSMAHNRKTYIEILSGLADRLGKDILDLTAGDVEQYHKEQMHKASEDYFCGAIRGFV